MYRLLIEISLICPAADTAHSSKRFSRLMKEHGIYQNGSLTGNEGQPATPKGSNTTTTNTPTKSGKKRKADHSTESHDKTDGEEEVDQVKKKSPKKPRKMSAVAAGKKKAGKGISTPDINDGSMLDDSIVADLSGGSEEASDVSIKAEEHADEV